MGAGPVSLKGQPSVSSFEHAAIHQLPSLHAAAAKLDPCTSIAMPAGLKKRCLHMLQGGYNCFKAMPHLWETQQ